ncbi:uncharacterized protein [Watersipora subatra]|uniref:uncharacterized protein n=1 Tax=Watersipora subatra TaxID=2589382 RepID=UPI00355C52B7
MASQEAGPSGTSDRELMPPPPPPVNFGATRRESDSEILSTQDGNMLLRFFNLQEEVNEFLKTHNKLKVLASMQVEGFHQCLAYLVDILGSINEVNTKTQVDKKAPSVSLLTNIKHHLNSLIAEFERYFSKLDSRTKQLMSMTRDPFRRNVNEIPEQLQEEFLKLTNNSALKDEFKELSIEHY